MTLLWMATVGRHVGRHHMGRQRPQQRPHGLRSTLHTPHALRAQRSTLHAPRSTLHGPWSKVHGPWSVWQPGEARSPLNVSGSYVT